MDRCPKALKWTSAALVAAALAVATPVRGDNYNGCMNLSNGKLRKLTHSSFPAPSCSSREQPVVLNGDPPDGGPDGPSDGPGSCHAEELLGNCNANTFAVLHGSCATGKVTGAGAIWTSPFDGADNGPFYIYPRSPGDNLWTIIPYNHTASASGFKFVLWCCQP